MNDIIVEKMPVLLVIKFDVFSGTDEQKNSCLFLLIINGFEFVLVIANEINTTSSLLNA
ncbi:hypothetical protein [Undibacterium sp. TJN19]|uniref:hypothetical protein n=1 Tax=Undibacterium sp. TJN19 TaxID=3413055 RepID=UPI003BF2BA7F